MVAVFRMQVIAYKNPQEESGFLQLSLLHALQESARNSRHLLIHILRWMAPISCTFLHIALSYFAVVKISYRCKKLSTVCLYVAPKKQAAKCLKALNSICMLVARKIYVYKYT